ncbi:hypothetical protein [Ornithobacterium rhinotracheale]
MSAQSSGLSYKQSIVNYLGKNLQLYHQLTNSLTTKGYIYQDRATYKLTEKGYEVLSSKRKLKMEHKLAIIGIIVSILLSLISWLFFK